MHSVDDLAVCLGDFNGHVGMHIDGVHGGYGVGQRNLDGILLLEFCLDKLFLSNTLFKREKRCKATFRLGEDETEINFVDEKSILAVFTKCEGNPWGFNAR